MLDKKHQESLISFLLRIKQKQKFSCHDSMDVLSLGCMSLTLEHIDLDHRLSDRTFCSDADSLYLCCPHIEHLKYG